jgi:hypothetical protein
MARLLVLRDDTRQNKIKHAGRRGEGAHHNTTLAKIAVGSITVGLILLQLVLARHTLLGRSGASSTGIFGGLGTKSSGTAPKLPQMQTTVRKIFSNKEADQNEALVQERRELMCTRDGLATLLFEPPPANVTRNADEPRPFPKRCKFSFIDLGANVGDSLGKLIDAGMPQCQHGDDFGRSDEPYRYSFSVAHCALQRVVAARGDDVEEGESEKESMLTNWVRDKVADFQRTHSSSSRTSSTSNHPRATARPEQYCYVGVEGNPRFETVLRTVEQCVTHASPRPLRAVHMYTQTVATGEGDGPTVLYLDTVNAKNNYFGSSLLSTHTDVRSSARNHDGTPQTAKVQGITLSSLIKDTVPFAAGSHVMVKIDIEGAEYALLNEAYDSGLLCECAQHGVRIDVRVEIHPKVCGTTRSWNPYNVVQGSRSRH